MTLENVSLASYITGLLRQNITDYNSVNRTSTFGNWIFADKPKIVKLLSNKNNFPRVSVESMSFATESEVGMSCTDHVENINMKITVWSVRDLICDVKSTDTEAHTYVTGTNEYELTNLPTSNISLVTGTLLGVPHTFTKGTDYQLIDNDLDGHFDSVQWLGVDLPDNGTDIAVSYQRKASADELCRFIAYEINEYLRDNWRDWTERVVWSYNKTGATPIEFDNEIGVHKFELTCSFQGINIGDII